MNDLDRIKKKNLKPFNPKSNSDYTGYKVAAIIIGIIILLSFINHVKQSRDEVLLQSNKDTITKITPSLLNPGTILSNKQDIPVNKVDTTEITPSSAPIGSSVVDAYMDPVYNKVAYDSEQQFFIAQRDGDDMQTYIQAGMVAAAYLQAKDETNYKKWKKVERRYARKIGL